MNACVSGSNIVSWIMLIIDHKDWRDDNPTKEEPIATNQIIPKDIWDIIKLDLSWSKKI